MTGTTTMQAGAGNGAHGEPGSFHAPTSLDEAAALLDSLGDSARLSAGATYLMLRAAHGDPLPAHLVSLHRIGGLAGVAEGEVGALATLRALERGAATGPQRALAMAASVTAGPPVRVLGTLGGNLGFVDGDLVPALLALDARVHFHDGGAMTVAEYVEARPAGRIMTAFTHDLRAADGWSGATVKLARRGMDWPVVTVAVAVRRQGPEVVDARAAAGALAADPVLLPGVPAALVGSEGEPEALEFAAEAATHRVEVRSDDEAPATYRRRVAGPVVRRALEVALRLGPDGLPALGEARR